MEANLQSVLEAGLTEITKSITEIKGTVAETKERTAALETKLSKPIAGLYGEEVKSLGQRVIEHDQLKHFLEGGYARSGRIPVTSFFTKTAIVTTSDTAPMPDRVRDIAAGRATLRLRDALSLRTTASDTVEYVRMSPDGSGSTNAAAPQGRGSSPQVYQNVVKAESAMAFSLASEPVQTIAHWVPCSKQVLGDNASLAAFVNGQMLYWLNRVLEDQLLNGTGGGGDLNGLVARGTAYDTALDAVGDTRIDTLAHARLQVRLAGYVPDVAVVHPSDLQDIELTKTTDNGGGEYLISSPGTTGRLWGMNIISSPVMTAGSFVAFDSTQALLYDRQEAVIEISREHSDFFVRNMIAILAELRCALVVPDPLSVVRGTFPTS